MELEPPEIRARLKRARERAGLSQPELADLMTVHPNTVQNHENVRVPYESLNDYAKLLNVSVPWLLWGDAALSPEGQARILAEGMERLAAGLADVREQLVEIGRRLDALGSD